MLLQALPEMPWPKICKPSHHQLDPHGATTPISAQVSGTLRPAATNPLNCPP